MSEPSTDKRQVARHRRIFQIWILGWKARKQPGKDSEKKEAR
jgi:hypothetical protein